MATLPSDNTPKTDALGPDLETKAAAKKRNTAIRQQVDACKQYRRKLVANWQTNIDYRRGKPFNSQTDEDRVAVNLDWSLTKQKQALLFSQVPAIRVNHPPHTIAPDVLPWLHAFETKINDTSLIAGIETAMDEVLPDCINAAGIGVVIVAREAITENVEVPAIDLATLPPEIQAQIMQSGLMPDGSPVPMETVPRVLDSRYRIDRISPGDFLWPINFTGSDFDNAPWLGRDGRITWASAVKRFGLKEADKAKYLGEDTPLLDRLTNDVDKDRSDDELVTFSEIFYKENEFDPAARSFSSIHHVVFVGGKEEPVIDEPWKGQQIDPESSNVLGAVRYPIRVLTLAYITDEAIPPSDTSIGRPQVNELNKSRSQMVQQREHSRPLRWVDINRIDPAILQAIMRGTWQGIIPVQGQGTNIIGEVSRSALPQENFTFDRIAKMDLDNLWQVGQGEVGSDIETKAEVNAIGNNMQTRISRERAKVGKFFCSIAEVLGGLICIYEDPSSIGEGFDPAVSKALTYSILADSTVLLDSNQRIKRLTDFMNFTVKSGRIDEDSLLKELATLHGLDPNTVIKQPIPRPPVEPNISLRLTGTEDMMNPLTLAFLMKSGQAPEPELIEKAKALIEAAVTPPAQLAQRPLSTPPEGPIVPESAPPPTGQANPDWEPMDRLNRRIIER